MSTISCGHALLWRVGEGGGGGGWGKVGDNSLKTYSKDERCLQLPTDLLVVLWEIVFVLFVSVIDFVVVVVCACACVHACMHMCVCVCVRACVRA